MEIVQDFFFVVDINIILRIIFEDIPGEEVSSGATL
jgi:hypothetical protein